MTSSSSSWWSDGEVCELCAIPFCHPHRSRAPTHLVWVGPNATAYHESPTCGATPSGVSWLARKTTALRFDFDRGPDEDDAAVDRGSALDGVAARRPGVPPGWKQVTVTEAAVNGLPACMRCRG